LDSAEATSVSGSFQNHHFNGK